MRNLRLAFPEKDEAWRRSILQASLFFLSRVLLDFSRLPRLTPAWVKAHVECDFIERYRELKRDQPSTGILVSTGHLGSFELLAHCMPMWGHPLSFVVRNFEWKALDRWWTKSRERYGNRVINRKGAFKEVAQLLRAGKDVALLFDQNVTRNHAAFVEWFGVLAATTKTPAIAALRAQCPVVVAGIISLPNDRYRVLVEECNFSDLYNNLEMTNEEKVFRITSELARRYEGMIRQQPEAWFWMHRRWRTRPEGETENLYAGC
jgi:KDO2-lipid IV(A) lauroyltransferase